MISEMEVRNALASAYIAQEAIKAGDTGSAGFAVSNVISSLIKLMPTEGEDGEKQRTIES